MSKIEIVEGKRVRILFEGGKCIHSRGCVLSRPDVFVPNAEGEWIHPDAATPDAVAEIAHQCPSGAIRYERLDGGANEEAPKVNTVRLRENGPLAFHAELRIAGELAGFRATLCRCGASKRKPYCDGSHAAAGFVASGEVPPQEGAALAQRAGLLDIKPAANGPLMVEGAFEVVTGTGETVNRTMKAALCRCGHSANKPYCDGTHKKIGFEAP